MGTQVTDQLVVPPSRERGDRHVPAAATMTRDLTRDSGDHVIVLHVPRTDSRAAPSQSPTVTAAVGAEQV
jgi:hypothetical protein